MMIRHPWSSLVIVTDRWRPSAPVELELELELEFEPPLLACALTELWLEPDLLLAELELAPCEPSGIVTQLSVTRPSSA